MDDYRDFLQSIFNEQMREGKDGWKLIGQGLLVPHPFPADSFEWEEKSLVYGGNEKELSFQLGSCATGCTANKEACDERIHIKRDSSGIPLPNFCNPNWSV